MSEKKKYRADKKMREFMALRDSVHQVCALLNRDCYLCEQMFPEIFNVCPYVRGVEYQIIEIILG